VFIVNNQSNCPNCGQPAQPDDKFCRNCGIPFKEKPADQEMFSETPPDSPIPPLPPPPPPTGLAAESSPPPEEERHVPWEEREKYGFFEAFWLTWKETIVNPDRFFSKLPYKGGMGSPILYAVIIGTIATAVSAVYGLIFSTAWMGILSRLTHQPDFMENMHWGTRWTLIQIPLAPFIVILGIFILSGIIHIIGKMFGWAKRDYEATLRAVAYSEAPHLFALVPFCGYYVSGIWALILVIIGYKNMQDTSTGKSVVVVLLPMIFCCCLLIILFGAAIMALITGAAASGGWDSF
jgi:hypothetical protein